MSSITTSADRASRSHKRVGYAVASMFVLHIVLISYLPWPENEARPTRAEVRLRLNRSVEEVVKAKPEASVDSEASEAEADSAEEHEVLPEPTSPSVNFGELREQMRRSISGLTGEQPVPGFSVATENIWTGKIGAGPFRKEAVNQAGMVTTRVVDRWGNARCLQQRGDPFDPETWAYHRVPLALCDFLR